MPASKYSHQTNIKLRLSNAKGMMPSKRLGQTSRGRNLFRSATLLLALLCSASIALADLKITTKSGASGQTMTSTTYIKGARQRTEGVGYTTIYQCDLKRMIYINDKTKTYVITPLGGANSSKPAGPTGAQGATRRGGVITYTTTSTDTTERKEMFGLTAKRMKSKTVVAASVGACNSMNMEMETDGWYADLPGGASCMTDMAQSLPVDQSDCVDEVRYKSEGAANTGYPLTTTTTIKFNMGADGPAIPPSSSTQEVTEVSTATLDRALFEIPAGYTEVKSTQELGSPY